MGGGPRKCLRASALSPETAPSSCWEDRRQTNPRLSRPAGLGVGLCGESTAEGPDRRLSALPPALRAGDPPHPRTPTPPALPF